MKKRIVPIMLVMSMISLCSFISVNKKVEATGNETEHPKIVNFINFIRLLEPRDANVTQNVLYQTVVSQITMMKKYRLGGSFLLQYDALMDSRYQTLLKSLPADSFEIGAWWEIPQPLVEEAGMKWRGRYPWDWYANVGFCTGYTPVEREKLVDVYMADFKKIYGYYPKSVGSWFIDAHTLNYMYEKYHIIASCNCKDQSGTDGYTLWGGYWNQAYYPSKINSFMPAQNEENQIPVPIFRMLGSDPIRQYDTGLGTTWQGVITLEPVYPDAGGSETWVNWFMKELVEGACMEFAYTQAGQENSFTWNAMSKGFGIQLPLISHLLDQKKVKVETLAQSGQWFKDHYKVTPATSMTVNTDINGSNRKTVWFNSKNYRINILWEDSTLRIRDIHLFDENYEDFYTKGVATSNVCAFNTLPFVDAYIWSTNQQIGGMRLKALVGGKEILLKGEDPIVTDSISGKLHICWPLKSMEGTLVIDLDEKGMTMKIEGNSTLDWYFDMTTADNAVLPYKSINPNQIDCQFDGMNYSVSAVEGSFSKLGKAFRLSPKENLLILKLSKSSAIVNNVSTIQENLLKVYPNPTNDILNVDTSLDLTNGRINIVDIAGKEVYSDLASATINVTDFNRGVFMLTLITQNDQKYSRSFVKQ